MPKLKAPLLSLEARGRLSKLFSLARRGGRNIIERKPIPIDAQSSSQLFNRHMFTKCVDLWHLLSDAEQQEWESLARPRHMSGYAWYISQCLRPNPGIYLPLQGGTMSGNIDMDNNRLLMLPLPTHRQEAANKYYADTRSKLIWKDASQEVLNDNNRVATIGYTDLDLTAATSPKAVAALLQITIGIDAINAGIGNLFVVLLRKNGTAPGRTGAIVSDGVRLVATSSVYEQRIVGLDSGQVMEWSIIVVGVLQMDTIIDVLGYWEHE